MEREGGEISHQGWWPGRCEPAFARVSGAEIPILAPSAALFRPVHEGSRDPRRSACRVRDLSHVRARNVEATPGPSPPVRE